MMLHGRHFAPVVERQSQRLDRRRAKRVETHVIGTGQYELYRLADGLGSERGGDRVIAVEPPAKSPANRIGAHDDALLRQAERLSQHGEDQALPLIARMDLETA